MKYCVSVVLVVLVLLGLSLGPATALPPKGKIAFVSVRGGDSEIYVMDMNATHAQPVQVTRSGDLKGTPGELTFSPDGKHLACAVFGTSTQGYATANILTMTADGSQLLPLTSDDFFNADPAWSPDGKQLLFSSNRQADYSEIDVADGCGCRSIQTLTPHQWYELNKYAPAWSPDGKRIAFAWSGGMNQHIDVMNADGSGITEIPPDAHTGDTLGGPPVWSPDSKQIAFAAKNASGIYVMNGDGSNRNVVSRGNVTGQGVAWSPDSRRLVFSGSPDEASTSKGNLFVVDANGQNFQNLTNGAVNYPESPAWSPDGKQIAFISNCDGAGDVYLINADGSGLVRWITGLAGGTPDQACSLVWSTH